MLFGGRQAGTGKTLLAAQLLLKSIGANKGSVMAFRNNRLMAILRKCFDNAGSGASKALVYSSVPMYQIGLADKKYDNVNLDFVICDEAQRFSADNIRVIMKRAPVTVFFHDELQILNPPEQGSTKVFEGVAAGLGVKLKKRSLGSPVRCRGGEEYQEWVEKLVKNEKDPILPSMANYRVEVFPDIRQMLGELGILAENHRVALVASFTESKGKIGNTYHKDNLRVGYPLPSGLAIYKDTGLNIPWLMDPAKDYTPYWLGGESNKLDRIASIYGCQGFESDYVGVVWGRDFVRRGDKWVVGDPAIITDNIDKLQTYVKSNGQDALVYFENRYRIFLTRGMLGTFIFCEDEETGVFLNNLD